MSCALSSLSLSWQNSWPWLIWELLIIISLLKNAKSLNLPMKDGMRSFKSVNGPAQKCLGDVSSVVARVVAWQGLVDLVTIKMSNFDFILVQDFIRQFYVVRSPHLGYVIFMEPCKPSMVGTIKFAQFNCIVSALRLGHVARKYSNDLYAAALFGEWDKEGKHPSSDQDVVKDVLPKYLHEGLPPQHYVDHNIELELGAWPPTHPPYRLFRLEMQ